MKILKVLLAIGVLACVYFMIFDIWMDINTLLHEKIGITGLFLAILSSGTLSIIKRIKW